MSTETDTQAAVRVAEATGVSAVDGALCAGVAQHHVSAVRCRCGHGRSGHGSYYFWTGSTVCRQDRECACLVFRADEDAR